MNCTSCGSPIPDGQGKSCSMCYGDPEYGRDGYYRQYLEHQEEQARIQQEAREYEETIEQLSDEADQFNPGGRSLLDRCQISLRKIC